MIESKDISVNEMIHLVGHWGSCNMGDKFQPYALLNILEGMPGVGIVPVNFSPGAEIYHHGKITPIDGLDVLESAEYIIVTTGSMSNRCPYVEVLSKIVLNEKLKRMIIWEDLLCMNLLLKCILNFFEIRKYYIMQEV
jgi:hypothetical protein